MSLTGIAEQLLGAITWLEAERMHLAADQVDLSILNNRLVFIHTTSNEVVRMETQHWLVAKIMNVFAFIFPCCVKGSAQIEINKKIFYVPRSTIIEKFKSDEDHPCQYALASENAKALKVIAMDYFVQKEISRTR